MNTLSRRKEAFVPITPGHATIYSCGPTVYSRAHIGNLRKYVFDDVLARVLRDADLRIRQVINITDVGHLVSDADEGEDKMEKEAKRAGRRAKDIAEEYTHLFLEDIRALGVDTERILFPHATEYITEQIAMVEELEAKGVTYRTADGIYFDTSAFPDYGKLGNPKGAQSLTEQVAGAGRFITGNAQKRHPADFALWKFSPRNEVREQEWGSPWGRGFPGWHLECSAMARALLGKEIDIHTGGEDHIAVHHNNEIAQSETANGKPFARYWLHSAFLTTGEKISKSLGNVIHLSDVEARGRSPRALRYLFLQAHYRTPLSFSWEALAAAEEALSRLIRLATSIKEEAAGKESSSDALRTFSLLVRDDLGTPQALAYLWEVLRDDEYTAAEKWALVKRADAVLGLSLTEQLQVQEAALSVNELPEDLRALVTAREDARSARDYAKADSIRAEIGTRGYRVDDGPSGPLLTPLLK